MVRTLLFAALLLGACVAARAEDDVDESDVVVLTDKNFEEKLGSAKFALVSPLCTRLRWVTRLCTPLPRFRLAGGIASPDRPLPVPCRWSSMPRGVDTAR